MTKRAIQRQAQRRQHRFIYFMMLITTTLLWSSSGHTFKGGISIDEKLFVPIGQVGSCSGTLIRFDRVLTAAHCLCIYLQNGLTDCAQTARFRTNDNHRRAIELFGHVYYFPGYKKISRDHSVGIDLAVILLDEASQQTTRYAIAEGRLGYVPLEDPNWSPVPGTQFTLVSWGLTGPQCQNWTGKNRLDLSAFRVDPPYMKFVDTEKHGCEEDSGSPALSANTRVAGVATAASPASGLTTYTMTSPFFQWIMAPR